MNKQRFEERERERRKLRANWAQEGCSSRKLWKNTNRGICENRHRNYSNQKKKEIRVSNPRERRGREIESVRF